MYSLRDGTVEAAEVPRPQCGRGEVLVRVERSLISAGTERMLLEFGHGNWIDKARQQPEKVSAVLDKIRTDGLMATADSIRAKLDQPITLGYSAAGRVLEVGEDVRTIRVGDRVACNGHHADVVAVAEHLCARVPRGVESDEAAFTVVGSIALHGIRLLEPTLGEVFAVSGLGLVGLLSLQILRASGCRTIGLDPDPGRVAKAESLGFEAHQVGAVDAARMAEDVSEGVGVDGVLVAASTSSSEPLTEAARMCRKRGRIVLVGVTGMELSRAQMYEKEIAFRVSCSYGPGRYDPEYERGGKDYPVGYVRWTEQRNFTAFLELLRTRAVQVEPLISHRFNLDGAESAYETLRQSRDALGILLEYASDGPTTSSPSPSVIVERRPEAGPGIRRDRAARVAVIGAGNYATRVLLPALAREEVEISTVVSKGGISATRAARQFGAARASTDVSTALDFDEHDAVVIATRHDSHASLVARALAAGLDVFVEKPLALSREGLAEVASALEGAPRNRVLMVGFNRRFAPLTAQMKRLLAPLSGPKALVLLVNAGRTEGTHWSQDAGEGGGRLVGEGCHFVDLARYLVGTRAVDWSSSTLADPREMADSSTLTMSYECGSTATVHYFSEGSKKFSKERITAMAEGAVLELDNFRVLRGYGWPGFRRKRILRQDKGNRAAISAFVRAISTEDPAPPIPVDELMEVSRISIDWASQAYNTVTAPSSP